jgi:hypothetical protein
MPIASPSTPRRRSSDPHPTAIIATSATPSLSIIVTIRRYHDVAAAIAADTAGREVIVSSSDLDQLLAVRDADESVRLALVLPLAAALFLLRRRRAPAGSTAT